MLIFSFIEIVLPEFMEKPTIGDKYIYIHPTSTFYRLNDVCLRGLDFKSGGGALLSGRGGAEFSEGQGELNFQRGLVSRGLPCFSGNMLFLRQDCHQLYSNIFDIAESLTQNKDGPI